MAGVGRGVPSPAWHRWQLPDDVNAGPAGAWHPAHDVRKKFNQMFERIQIPRLKVLAQPLIARAHQQLDAAETALQGTPD